MTPRADGQSLGMAGRLGRRVKNGVYSLGVRLWNSDISCN